MPFSQPRFEADFEERRNRLTTLVRVVLAIPHIALVSLWGIAAAVLVVLAWFALVFTGRYPRAIYDFVADFLRYSTYAYGYMWLLADRYPPFSGDPAIGYPVRLQVPPSRDRYGRAPAALRFIPGILVVLVIYVMQVVYQLAALLAWLMIVVLGRQNKGVQDLIVLGLSYQQRGLAYLALVSEELPAFTDAGIPPDTGEPAPRFGALPTAPAAGERSHQRDVPPGTRPESP